MVYFLCIRVVKGATYDGIHRMLTASIYQLVAESNLDCIKIVFKWLQTGLI